MIVQARFVDSAMQVQAQMTSVLKANARFIDGTMNVVARFASAELQVEADFINPVRTSQQYEDYTGDYEVTSFCAEPLLTTSLILPTSDKHMLDNVTVYSVPTSEEYNTAGGVTFTIGG